MTDEMLKDLTDAIGRLQATFEKHGLKEPLAIALGSIEDFHNLRNTYPPSQLLYASDPTTMHRDVACKVRGVSLVHPLSVRETT